MTTDNYPRTRRILPALALAITLAGCSATDDYYAAQRITAESNSTVASAQLASTQALSTTVGTLTTQNAALVNTVTAQAAAWQIVAVILATGLAVSVVLAVLIASRRRTEAAPTVVYMLPNSPTHDAPLLDALDMRAMRLTAQRREMDARRLTSPEARYQLTNGR